MIFKIEIISNIEAVKLYINNMLQDAREIPGTDNRICGRMKNNKIFLYIATNNRFPSGFSFRGKLIEERRTTLIKGVFYLPLIRIIFYAWFFGISIHVFNKMYLITILPCIVGVIILLIDLKISCKYKERIIVFLTRISSNISR